MPVTGGSRAASARLLLNIVTEVAVLPDDSPVRGLVLIVVAAEAAGGIRVAEIVLVRAPAHLHRRKHVAGVEPLRRADQLIDLAAVGGRQRCVVGAVEPAQALADLALGGGAIGVG